MKAASLNDIALLLFVGIELHVSETDQSHECLSTRDYFTSDGCNLMAISASLYHSYDTVRSVKQDKESR